MTVDLDHTITTADAAGLLDVTPRRVRQLVADGTLPAEPSGRMSLRAAVRAYVGFIRSDAARSTQAAAGARVRDARAREIELRIAEKERTLCHVDEAIEFVDGVLGAMKADLIGLPSNVTRDPILRAAIEAAVDGVLTRSADRARDRGRALQDGRA